MTVAIEEAFPSIYFYFDLNIEKNKDLVQLEPLVQRYLTALTIPNADFLNPIIKNLNELEMYSFMIISVYAPTINLLSNKGTFYIE